jgi:hypothetical protein
MYICPITNRFRDRATCISLYGSIVVRQGALSRAKRHVLTRVAKCIDGDSEIFENALCYVNGTNCVT